jgi:hypothetical protein
MNRNSMTLNIAAAPLPLQDDARDEPRPDPETTLMYCGVVRQLFEVVKDGHVNDIRCPLCGFRHGEV